MKSCVIRWAAVFFLLISVPCLAQDIEGSTSVREGVAHVINDLDFEDVRDIRVPGIAGSGTVEDAVAALSSGDSISAEDAVSSIIRMFLDSVSGLGRFMLSMMLPVLLSGLLSLVFVEGTSANGMLARSVSFMLFLIPVISAAPKDCNRIISQ